MELILGNVWLMGLLEGGMVNEIIYEIKHDQNNATIPQIKTAVCISQRLALINDHAKCFCKACTFHWLQQKEKKNAVVQPSRIRQVNKQVQACSRKG